MARKPCAHANITPDKLGRVIMRKDAAYKCRYPVPDIVLPLSITRSYGFNWPPIKNPPAFKDMCEACPCWTPRETGETADGQ